MSRDEGPAPARASETLDIASVDRWLQSRIPDLGGPPRVTQYATGASNWTYRLEYPGHDLVLRRPPAGTKAKSAHDMQREYRVQQALAPHFPHVPEMVAFCGDPEILGVDFYVMRRIPGLIPREPLPRGLELPEKTARALCRDFVDRLADLHGIDVESTGLASLGRGPGYVRRQVEGWVARFEKARTWNAPRFRSVIAWLAARIPEDAGASVIHNDYRLDNVVVDPADPTRVAGVLDWEMATVGDPLMDLGNSLAYWIEAGDDPIARRTRRQPTTLPGMLSRSELVERYCARRGIAIPDVTFYEVQGIFRLAAIAQQIYYRFHHGQTRNPAFRHFWILGHYLEWRCRRRIRATL